MNAGQDLQTAGVMARNNYPRGQLEHAANLSLTSSIRLCSTCVRVPIAIGIVHSKSYSR